MKCVEIGLLLLLCLTSANAGGEGWDWISGLKGMNGSEFKNSIYPIIQMAANAYRYPKTIEVPGWTPSSLVPPVAPSQGGVHVLAYRQETSNKIVIAFRGTQITDLLDGLADICADMLLWDGLDFNSLPPKCSIFTYSTLDYFSQALNFTRHVMDAYPGYPLLLTGHSLGAGLAVLVSAALSENSLIVPVIGFGPPATLKPLERRSLHLRAADEGKVILVANEWDEIMRTQWEGQLGTLCLYQTVETEACTACFDNFEVSGGWGSARLLLEKEGEKGSVLPEGNCIICFMQTHILKTLIKLVQEGSKPICQERLPTIQISGSESTANSGFSRFSLKLYKSGDLSS
ncbi:uncharacterized protein LOC131076906 isoform X2 [Cryptomeria japonica]|uniref:uncharacterized protein LOC131076906 isoform X2 n=1 Tax=Cryptomeria japonica TaxID=3369 RepID=UPI0027DA25AA|nr:uncharacterized protein LOC131076906 isoform X2 [Cryptomeria japonica]